MRFIIKKDFNEVVEENTAFVTSIVRKFVKDTETVKDLTQEIFLKAYINYERYIEEGKLRAWLSVIAHNMLKNHYKTEQYHSNNIVLSPIEYISEELLPYKNMPEDIIIQRDFLDRITKIINSLPEKQRDVIIYSYFYDYSEKEIASIQDMSLSAVKSAKHFGLQKVKKLLGFDYETGAAEKYNLNRNLGRYRMVKCYTYSSRGLFENTELQNNSIIEGISPTKKEISDIAKVLNIGEDTVKALTIGDIDKVKKNNFIASATFNDKLNVIFHDNENLLICHDGRPDEYKDLIESVRNIWAMVAVSGYINIDFFDLCTLFKSAKSAAISTGRYKGGNKSEAAIKAISSSPQLADMIDGSYGVAISITGNPNHMRLEDVDNISMKVRSIVSPNANIVWGVSFDGELDDDEVSVTLMAT